MKSKYSAEEMFQIVMESFLDNVSRAEICRRHSIYPVQFSRWKGNTDSKEEIEYRIEGKCSKFWWSRSARIS
ncbi:MAG: transposase [Thermoplasmatales archaeon]